MSEKKKTEPNIAEKKVSRRSMLKWTGALAGAAIVGAVAEYGASELMKPVPPPPTPPPSFKPPLSADVKARVDAIKKQLIDMHTGEEIHYTDCDANGCRGGACVLKVRTKNGVITAIENGDPVCRGMTIEDLYAKDAVEQNMIQARPCTRAYMWPKTVYHPDRLLYPMKRVGNRGERKFTRITWQEALDTIVTNLKTAKEKYGPYFMVSPPRVGSYAGFGYAYWGYTSGSDRYLIHTQMMGKIDYGKYSGFGTGLSTSSNIGHFFQSKAFVGFGENPAINHYGGGSGNQWTYCLRYVKEKTGIPFIIIDPIYSLSCESLADQWIPIRAGTDLAMFLAMANVLFKEDLYDKEYIGKCVEPTGFAKWKDYVLGKTAGPDGAIDRTPEWAEKICGVPAETIAELTRFCARNKPLYFNAYYTPGKKMYGEMAGWAIECLKVMLGIFGAPGGSEASPATYLTSPAGQTDWKRAKAPWNLVQLHWMRTKTVSAYLYPKLAKGEITEDYYRKEIGCAKDWPLPRPVVFWMGSTHGDMNLSQRWAAYKEAYFNVSTAYHSTYPDTFNADIVLPLADSHFEDYYGWAAGTNMFELARKSVDPPGECKTAGWIDMQLENRFGVLQKSEPLLAGVLDDPKKIDEVTESVYKAGYEAWAARDDIKLLNPPSWADFDKLPVFRVPHIGQTYAKQNQPPYNGFSATFLADPVKYPFDTPSGKMEFYSSFLADPEMASKEWIKPQTKIKSEICFGGASPPVIPPMAEFVPEWNGPLMPYAEKYPLNVVSLHSNYLQHHSQDNNPYRREQCRHACYLSVADAKARGIKDGDLVRVTSEFGEIVMPAYVTSRVVPGTSNVGYGAWYEPSSAKTDLMPDGIDRRGAHNFLTPSLHYPWPQGCAAVQHNCQVEKFDTSL